MLPVILQASSKLSVAALGLPAPWSTVGLVLSALITLSIFGALLGIGVSLGWRKPIKAAAVEGIEAEYAKAAPALEYEIEQRRRLPAPDPADAPKALPAPSDEGADDEAEARPKRRKKKPADTSADTASADASTDTAAKKTSSAKKKRSSSSSSSSSSGKKRSSSGSASKKKTSTPPDADSA